MAAQGATFRLRAREHVDQTQPSIRQCFLKPGTKPKHFAGRPFACAVDPTAGCSGFVPGVCFLLGFALAFLQALRSCGSKATGKKSCILAVRICIFLWQHSLQQIVAQSFLAFWQFALALSCGSILRSLNAHPSFVESGTAVKESLPKGRRPKGSSFSFGNLM